MKGGKGVNGQNGRHFRRAKMHAREEGDGERED